MRAGIRHSVYKLALVAHTIKKKHLWDAQNTLNNIDKKAADIIRVTLNSAR